MGKVIAVEIGKGGSGKSTTVVNTAAILGEHGKRVCVLDADASGNCTKRSGLLPQDYAGSKDSPGYSMFNVLKMDRGIKDCIVKTKFGYDIVPSTDELEDIVVTLFFNIKKYPDPMNILKNAVDEIKNDYDYILIDTPPTISFSTITTLLASDAVIIPMQVEDDAFDGAKAMIKKIYKYKPGIEIMGILPTMFIRGTDAHTTTLAKARRLFEGKIRIFDTTIYRTTEFAKADGYRQPAIVYSDNKNVQEYREFVKECFEIG
jgi:chromosome partitioning protein